jgi:uncharacterized membrane protein
MTSTTGGGIIVGLVAFMWLIYQDRRAIVCCVCAVAIGFVMSMLPAKADHVPQRVSSGQVQR